MNRNELKIALRGLWRRRTFSFLNVLGLAVGLAASLVLFLLIQHELSFDRFHSKGNRIYRVISAWSGGPDGSSYDEGVPVPLSDAVRNDFPQFQEVAACRSVTEAQYTIPAAGVDGKKLQERDGIFYTESSLFKIFDFPWVAGDPATAINAPNTMAIEESVAKSWFGDWQAALGKTVLMDNTTPFTITGILRDHPENTDMPVRIALSYASYPARHENDWYHVSNHQNCFVLLKEGQRLPTAGVPDFIRRHYTEEDKTPDKSSIQFQPLEGMHFDERVGTYGGNGIGWKQIWALSLIGVFLLLVACINFVNLSTAQSVNRSKEIGVRKVLGSSRGGLIRQFFGETALITAFALVLACIFAELALPWLRSLLGIPIRPHASIFIFLGVAWILVTLLSGFYPGLVLSGFNPIAAIRNKVNVGGISLRRVLVVFQFAIAQILVLGTLVVLKQMSFFDSRPQGFDRKAIALVSLPTDTLSRQKFAYLRQLVLGEQGVESASLCSSAPSSAWLWDGGVKFENGQAITLRLHMADTAYYRTFGIRLLAGRLPFPSDTVKEYLLNEKAVHKLGYANPRDVLGKVMRAGPYTWPIVGVVSDFNSASLHDELAPMGLSTKLDVYKVIAVRVDPARIKETMQRVQADWEKIFPGFVYNQVYFDDDLKHFYDNEAKTAQLFKFFAGVALLISCLGLYGLVSFMIVQRRREMGIRKVLGASVEHIVYLFSREFTLLVGLGFVVSAPIGYYFMQRWLNGFYYRIDMGWKVFAFSVLGSVLLAWVTVGTKAFRAATANPINNLRTE